MSASQGGQAGSNTLYSGDNLDSLRRSIADESVDLIYPDSPRERISA